MYCRHACCLTPIRICLVDVSNCRWGNPCSDLAYLLYPNLHPELMEPYLEELLRHYHDTFTQSLAHLGQDSEVYPYRFVFFILVRA